jgi:monoamine oxidase
MIKHNFHAASASQEADMIIVGAGLSGLSMAFSILESAEAHNLPTPHITILEADQEPGGRVRSVELGGHILNTGGQWLHDSAGNPFTRWLVEHYQDLTYSDDPYDQETLMESGSDARCWDEVGALLHAAYVESRERSPDYDPPLSELLKAIGHPHAQSYVRHMAPLWMGVEAPSQISAEDYFSESYGEGGPQVLQGMSHVIKKMTDELKGKGVEIHTSTPVSRVEQHGEKLKFITADGRRFRAAAGAITVSAGVLQKGMIAFDPILPAKISDYIANMNMGRMTKISIAFRENFFRAQNVPENKFINLVSDEEPDHSMRHLQCHLHSMGRPFATILTGGETAEEIEQKTEREIASLIRGVFSRLSLYMKGYEAAMTDKPYVTTWAANPYTCGAYSSMKPGTKRSDPMMAGGLIFAGEAFIRTDEYGKDPGGTMSAAWSSGRLAAKEIFPLLQRAMRGKREPVPVYSCVRPSYISPVAAFYK